MKLNTCIIEGQMMRVTVVTVNKKAALKIRYVCMLKRNLNLHKSSAFEGNDCVKVDCVKVCLYVITNTKHQEYSEYPDSFITVPDLTIFAPSVLQYLFDCFYR